jgi:hypothetical protein
MDGHERGFGEVDSEARRPREGLQEAAGTPELGVIRAEKQKRVVGVLNHRTRQVIYKRVPQPHIGGVANNELLQDIGDDVEQIRRQGVSLT